MLDIKSNGKSAPARGRLGSGSHHKHGAGGPGSGIKSPAYKAKNDVRNNEPQIVKISEDYLDLVSNNHMKDINLGSNLQGNLGGTNVRPSERQLSS